MKLLMVDKSKLVSKTVRVCVCWLMALGFSVAYANPVLDHVASGNVAVSQTPSTTTVNQSSQQAIINWHSFNINKNETTHFQQPAGGVALNRINPSQGASQIYGNLTATGRIILVNGAGIFFGPSAYVNVGGIIASTADISDQNFLKGIYKFDGVSNYNGSVVNQGTIIAMEHGLVALLGNGVRNDGTIVANMGQVVLASGSAFTMSFDGSNLISFTVDGKAMQGVKNDGYISADGGQVLVTAKAAQGVLDDVINMDGVVQARSVSEQDGNIVISGDDDAGVVSIGGELDASGVHGGNVTVTGYDIMLSPTASINVNGATGGGTILVGGNLHGEGNLPHANAVVMELGAQLSANATQLGDGGEIVLWSDNVTKTNGYISAQGGVNGGNGGMIETSSKHDLEIGGVQINTLAAKGKTGTWLLDPTDVIIDNNPDANSTFSGGVYQPTDGSQASSTINASNLVAQLNTTNVEVTTSPFAGSGGAGVGDITVNATINWSGATTLTLTAENNIVTNADITAASGSLVMSAAGDIDLNNPINVGGTVSMTSNNINFINNVTSGLDQTYTTTTEILLDSNVQLQSLSGAVNIPSNVVGIDGNGFGLTIDVAASSSIDTVIADSSGLVKNGTGNLTLSQPNTYTGTTTINNGSITVVDNNSLGDDTALVVINGGGLDLSGSSLVVNQTMQINNGSTILDSNVFDANTLTGALTFAGTVTIQVDDAFTLGNVLTLSGVLNGSPTLNKTGVGALSITNANGLTGQTNVTAGSVIVADDTALGTMAVTVAPTATLQLSGSALTVNNIIDFNAGSFLTDNSFAGQNTLSGALTFDGANTITVGDSLGSLTLSGLLQGASAAITKAGSGMLMLDGSVANTYAHTFDVQTGIVQVQTSGAFGGSGMAVTVENGAAVNLLGTSLTLANTFTLNGTGISGSGALYDDSVGTTNTLSGNITLGSTTSIGVTNSGNSLVLSGVIDDGASSFGFSKIGNGILVLSNANTFGNASNGVTISAGEVEATNNTAFGVATAPVSVTAGAMAAVSGSGLNIANPITINSTGIGGAGALLDMSGTNTWSGAIALGSASSVGVTSAADTFTLSGVISGGNNFAKVGSGIVALSNTNTFTGTTTVSNGVLRLTSGNALGTAGTHTSSVTVANGAELQLSGVVMAPTLALSLDGSGVGSAGALAATGTSTWNGAISLVAASSTTIGSTGALTINGTINNNANLTFSGAGSVTLQSAIGGTSALLSITSNVNLNVNGGSVATTGTQTYNNPVVMGANTTFDSTGNNQITFSTIDRDASVRTLTIGHTGNSGGIALNGTLGAGVNGALGAVTLDSSGTTTLGGTIAAASITTDAGGTTQINNTGITTTGNQSYGDNVTLGASPTLISGAGTINFAGTVNGLTQTITLQNAAATGAVTFNGNLAVNGLVTTAGAYSVSLLGTLNSISNPVTFLNTNGVTIGDGVSDVSNFNGGVTSTASTTTLDGTLNTSNDAVSLGAVTLTGNTTISTGTGTIGLTGAVSGAFNLNVISSTGTTFGGGVNIAALDASGGGTDNINTTTITTSGTQAYHDAVSLGANVTLTTTTSPVSFDSTINGAHTLTVAAAGSTVTFSGAVGNTTRLTSVAITGLSDINGGSVLTTGTQNYAAVNLGATTGLDSSTGDVIITGALNGGSSGLTITNAGALSEINGNITNLTSLTKNGVGTLAIAGVNNSAYSGTTTLNTGTLVIAFVTNSLGSGALVLNGGNLQSDITATIANSFTLGGSTSINGSNNLTLSGPGTLTTGTLTSSNTAITTLSGNLSGAGNLAVSAGELSLFGANTYTGSTSVSGGQLTLNSVGALGNGVLNSSGVTVSSNATMLINSVLMTSTVPVVLSGVLASNGSSSYAGSVTLNSGSAVTVNGTVLTLSGAIGGSATLTKNGTGTLVISNTGNNYAGATNINVGALQLGASGVLPDSTDVVIAASSTLDLNNFNETINTLASTFASSSVTLGSGRLTTGGTADTSFSGGISGTGGLTKQGVDTFTLAGSNTYTGTTTVTNGTLSITNNNGLGSGVNFTSALTINSGATLNLGGVTITPLITTIINGDLTATGTAVYDGNIFFGSSSTVSSPGTLTLNGAVSATLFTWNGSGTLLLSNAGNNFSGDVDMNAGILRITANNAFTTPRAIVASGGRLDLNGFNDTVLTLTGTGSVTLGGGTLTLGEDIGTTIFGGVISQNGNVIKQGTGTWDLQGNNTFVGTLTINNGTVALQTPNALATTTDIVLANVVNTSFDISGASNTTVHSIAGGGATGGNISLGNFVLTVSGATTTTYSGVISGSGTSGLTFAGGGLVLAGLNTYGGATTINSGILFLGVNNALPATTNVTDNSNLDLNGFNATIASLAGSGNMLLTGGGTLTTGSASSTTYSGVMSGPGNLIKQGSGTFTLSGNNVYSGSTTVSAGTLSITNSNGLGSVGSHTTGVAVTAGAALNLNAVTIVATVPLTLNGTGITSNGALMTSGTSSYAGAVTLNTDSSINVSGSATTLTLNGAVGGAGGLTKIGAGTLIYANGGDNYLGATTITLGTLQSGASDVIPDASDMTVGLFGTFDLHGFTDTVDSLAGSGNVLLGSGGVLTTGSAANTTFSGVISQTGDVVKQGSGIFTLSNQNTFSGNLIINAGTVQAGTSGIASNANVQLANVAGATLDLNNFDFDAVSIAGGGALGGNITLGTGNLAVNNTSPTTYSGTISGSGNVAEGGTSTWTLNGTNIYTGATNVIFGTLIIGSVNALGTVGTHTSSIDVSSGAALTLTGGAISAVIPLTLNGGALNETGVGSYPGAITLASSSNINSTGSLGLTGIIGGGSSATLSSVGSGTLILTRANTYLGATVISNNGVLVAANAHALGDPSTGTTVDSNGILRITVTGIVEPLTLSNGTLDSVGTTSLTGNMTLGAGTNNTINSNGGLFTMVGTVDGGGALTLQGAGGIDLSGNLGSGTRLSSLNVTAANSTIDAAQIKTTGNQSFSNAVLLATSATFDSSTGSIAFNSTLDGAFDLNIISGGSTTFAGAVGTTPLNSLTITASSLALNGGSVSTAASQSYSGAIVLGATTTLTTTNGDIAITNGISGGQNLTLAAGGAGTHDFTLSGSMSLNNVNVAPTAGSSNNVLTVNSGGAQNWLISAANGGSLTGVTGVTGAFTFSNVANVVGSSGNDSFALVGGGSLGGTLNGGAGTNSLTGANVVSTFNVTGVNTGNGTGVTAGFSNIQNLVGGSADNTFVFSPGATVNSINGGSLVSVNDIDYSGIGAGITVTMSDVFTGTTRDSGNAVLNSYSNVNQLNGNFVNDTINVSAKAFTVVQTAFMEGLIDDPLHYIGFLITGSSPIPPVPPGPPPSFGGPVVPPIVDGPIINQQPPFDSEPVSGQPPILIIGFPSDPGMLDFPPDTGSGDAPIINPTCYSANT